MTESIIASDHSPELTKSQRSWLPSLLLGLFANAAIWGLAFVYLNNAIPLYTSKWSLTLPGGGFSSNVDLPNIGAASSQVGAAYGINRDPRENYKFVISSEPVLRAAANQLNMPPEEFPTPRVKVIDNSTLMTFELRGGSPEESQRQSVALYEAFQDRLTELRVEEANQRREKIQSTLDEAQVKLELAQKRVSEYKSRSGLVADAQIEQLSSSIEQLRRQKAEIVAQGQDTGARLRELSTNLQVAAPQAGEAFSLKVDPLFSQYRQEYSDATVALGELESRYGPNHPAVVRERRQQQAAEKAMQARSQVILGRSAGEQTMAQLNIGSGQERSSRETLFYDLVTTQVEQQGNEANTQELDKQISQLEKRLQTLSEYGSTLDALNRDLQIAETVFSATLTGLDLGKSEISATYPQVQLLTEPSLPRKPTTPNKTFTFLGAALGSLLVTTGLVLLEVRQHQRRKRESFARLQDNELVQSQSRWLNPDSNSEVLDLSKKQ
ncbi:GumC family protein [Lyngbya aestuarii]|uniref:GumC family protein n=1 Tax=Lyngbya aestuarii TaxID=118322 RepID=UPI00403DF73A